MNDVTTDAPQEKGPQMTQPKDQDFDSTYTRLLKQFTEMDVPACPLCRATDTASVQVGIIGLTIRLAATCHKFKLIPNGPKPGHWFCKVCERFFDTPDSDAVPPA
jgi:hypothetical protein